MRLRRIAILVATASLIPGLAACGVPTSSRPIIRGTAPEAPRAAPEPVAHDPQGPDNALSAQDLVQRYLQAAAWGNSTGADRPDAVDKAELLARRFLTDSAASQWSAGDRELVLVRVTLGAPHFNPNGSTTIEAVLDPVGILTDVGSVEPATTAGRVAFSFVVVSLDGGRRRLDGAPSGLFLNVETLSTWYDTRTIYFWDTSESTPVLVPDVRYMPKVVTQDKQPSEVWRWLKNGPSSLLSNAVQPVPDNLDSSDNVVTEQQHGSLVLILNLTSEAARAGARLQSLVTQLRWSLRPDTTPVELRIEGVKKKDIDGSSSKYVHSNPSVWPAGEEDSGPDRYAVIDGRATEIDNDSDNGRTRSVLAAPENSDVVSAATAKTGDQQVAALVRADGAGRQRLWIGRLNESGAKREPHYVDTGVTASVLSRPVWILRPFPQVLIAVDGRLKVVTEDRARDVSVSSELPGGVTAVSAAPDGRRLALVAGGVAGIAPLRSDHDALILGRFRKLDPGLVEVNGIGWSREGNVLVGGKANTGSPLVGMAVDGTSRVPIDLADLPGLVIMSLAAFPEDPVAGRDRLLAMIETNDQAFNVYGKQVIPITQAAPIGASPGTQVSIPKAPFFFERS